MNFKKFICILLLLCCFKQAICDSLAQQCNQTFQYVFNTTTNLKSNKLDRLRIGILGTFTNDQINACRAMAHILNNDPNILPDVGIDIYSSRVSTTSEALQGALFHIENLDVHGLVGGYLSAEAKTIQYACQIFSVPQISPNALSYSLSNKDDNPYFMRTVPNDMVQINAIIKLFGEFGWKKAIVVYTTDDYGSGYSRLALAGSLKNISFFAISVPATATTKTSAATTVATVKATIDGGNYRVIIYYTQYGPGQLVRQGLNESGYFGKDYVSIITSSMTGRYTGKTGAKDPLNEGCIGLGLTDPGGDMYKYYISKWNSTGFPIKYIDLASNGWYMIDAFLTFAFGFDALLKSGFTYNSINGSDYLRSMIRNNFTGGTGPVSFDRNGDRQGSYNIYSITPKNATLVAIYSGLTDTYTQTGRFVWAGGSTITPRDSPYLCKHCQHGTCVVDVGCVCFKGYSGSSCEVKDQTNVFVGAGVGGGVFIIAALVAGIIIYKKKRDAIVKEVSEKQRSNISRSDLALQNRIGRGASGEVFKAQFRGTEVAVKKIITSSCDKAVIDEFELEVAIMCGLRHPNIILFMGSCYDAVGKEMLLVMEFMGRGSLHDVLHNNKLSLNLEMKLHLACQAAQGMNFLHMSSPPIIHRDLKSHNILLDDKWNARISDFGITKFKDGNKSSKSTHEKSIGTIYWSAPEVLEGGEAIEKSDCYSFGIVLWEIFHRQNPYQGRDPVAVAIDVIHNNMRPPMNGDVPDDMQALIRACWDKDAEQRPTFQDIVTTLRSMSMKNPSYMGNGGMRVDAPSGMVYLVNTGVQEAFSLWEAQPKAMCEAMTLHNALVRSNMEMYRGYESVCDFHSFLIAFSALEDAVNFCIATQIGLLHVNWPIPLLKLPLCAQVVGSNGEVIWNGLRVHMAMYSGVPNCEYDSSTDRMVYMGPVVDKANKMLRGIKKGTIVVTDSIVEEITKKKIRFIQNITTRKCGEMNDTARNGGASIHRLRIQNLEERDSNGNSASGNPSDPHSVHVVDVEELDQPTSARSHSLKSLKSTTTDRSVGWELNTSLLGVEWLVDKDDVDMKEPIGKGSMGDYHRATWKNKEVAIKILVNQKLKEGDMLRLISDSAIMSKISHPNILPFHAVCLGTNHLFMVSEFMARGNLKAMLADNSINLSMSKRMKIGLDIANGMSFLTNLSDEDMQKHDNLKSNNILIGKDWEVKIADYGQSNLKDLARTMTSVGSVAWTAPELLTGEAESSPKIATYSFGIIMWELYTRQIPYASEHPIRVVQKILSGYRPAIPNGCPPALTQLISDCLKSDPDERPSWDSIISSLSNIVKSMPN